MKREKAKKIFSNIPELHTQRLRLRPMHITDACDMYEYACNEELTKYLLWSPHTSVDYTRDYLKYVERRYSEGEFYDWAIELDGKMIGTVGFTKIDFPHNSGEIGYVLNPKYQRRGLGTEAADKIIEFGFSRLGLHRIEARFMQGNSASLRVMEKLGMTLEGYHRDSMLVKGSYRTVGVCAILKDEYDAQAFEAR